jgi:hypothetical protein
VSSSCGQLDDYREFCETFSPMLRPLVLDYFGGAEFDALLVEIVCSTFPAHEHEEMVTRHRGLVAAWLEDQR